MALRLFRNIFVVLCMITGGFVGGLNAVDIQQGITRLANASVPKQQSNIQINNPNLPDPNAPAPHPKPAPIVNGKPSPVKTPLTHQEAPVEEKPNAGIPFTAGCVIVGGLIGLVISIESLRVMSAAGHRLEEMEPEETACVIIGIVLGVIVTAVFIPLLAPAGKVFPLLLILAGTAFIYLGITAANHVVGLLPTTSRGPIRRKAIKILDTNVIIDGRVSELCRTGFLEGQIYIPRFVLDELQLIADSSDQLRRARGRRGLDILKLMQKEYVLEIGSQDRNAPDAGEGVDGRLVKLAKAIGADIVTNDYNLNKVAEIQGIKVLNINDLALALKPNVLPGEELTVLIIKDGREQNQGVAYLDDGTMVVVEGGRKFIGDTVDVNVTSVLQTTAGKMIFAEMHSNGVDQSVRGGPRSRRPD